MWYWLTWLHLIVFHGGVGGGGGNTGSVTRLPGPGRGIPANFTNKFVGKPLYTRLYRLYIPIRRTIAVFIIDNNAMKPFPKDFDIVCFFCLFVQKYILEIWNKLVSTILHREKWVEKFKYQKYGAVFSSQKRSLSEECTLAICWHFSKGFRTIFTWSCMYEYCYCTYIALRPPFCIERTFVWICSIPFPVEALKRVSVQ